MWLVLHDEDVEDVDLGTTRPPPAGLRAGAASSTSAPRARCPAAPPRNVRTRRSRTAAQLGNLGVDPPVTDDDGNTIAHRPYYVSFDKRAESVWEEFTGAVADRMNALDPFDSYRGVLSKSRHHTLRLTAL